MSKIKHNPLPWQERAAMLSINPDAATKDDVVRLAAEHIYFEVSTHLLRSIIALVDVGAIQTGDSGIEPIRNYLAKLKEAEDE